MRKLTFTLVTFFAMMLPMLSFGQIYDPVHWSFSSESLGNNETMSFSRLRSRLDGILIHRTYLMEVLFLQHSISMKSMVMRELVRL